MYTIDDLNVRLLSELKEIAEGMGVKNAKKLAKQELVYKILDLQAVIPETETPAPKKTAKKTTKKPTRKKVVMKNAPKLKRANKKPTKKKS